MLASKRDRSALADEPMPSGPEVAIVSKPISFACLGERLAWAGSGPDPAVVGPSGHAEGERPAAEPGKEMTLDVAGEIGGADIADVALVHVSGWNKSICAEVAEPFRRVRVDFVVVDTSAQQATRLPTRRTVLSNTAIDRKSPRIRSA